jgi:DNA polymerase
VKVLKLRQQQARTSVRKYNAILQRLSPDNRIRHILQYGGASRTLRWAGRAMQPQNLPRTPKKLEAVEILEKVSAIIRAGDYDELELWCEEPMDALAGLVRSSIHASEGEFKVCDLSSIESRVIAWLTGCKRLLEGLLGAASVPIEDFAPSYYKIEYDEVTKGQRTDAKPAVLGAGFRLGGGAMIEGKKTGLWGYAENMGIELRGKDSHKAVKHFPQSLQRDSGSLVCLRRGNCAHDPHGPQAPELGRSASLEKPYLTAELPSGRKLWYLHPRVRKAKIKYVDKDGKTLLSRKTASPTWGSNRTARSGSEFNRTAASLSRISCRPSPAIFFVKGCLRPPTMVSTLSCTSTTRS